MDRISGPHTVHLGSHTFTLGLIGWVVLVIVIRLAARYSINRGHFADVLTAMAVAVLAFAFARSIGWTTTHGLDGHGMVALAIGGIAGYGAFHLIRRTATSPPEDDPPRRPRPRRRKRLTDEPD